MTIHHGGVYLVRIAKRLVRFNVMEDEGSSTTRVRYSCEKCGQMFGSWKHLRLHKVEKHSY